MQVFINLKPVDLPEGARLSQVVELLKQAKKDDPMLKHHQAEPDKTGIFFVVNGKVVRAEQYDSWEVKEGDQIRWFMPYAGG